MTEATAPRGRIILVEDDEPNRRALEQALRKNEYEVTGFSRGEEAVEAIRGGAAADLVVTDLKLPGLDGLGVLREVKAIDPGIAVLLVTAYGTVESAVEAMKIGADDYLTKPLNLYEVRHRVRALVEKRRLSQEVAYLHARLDKTFGLEGIVGRSAPMRNLFDQIRLVAPTRTSVLIVGESGTGKELIANAIHHLSPRRQERFIALNCSAIPKTLLESEVFGHERGAFTGATGRVAGKFELAHRGTLFLDEVGELTQDIQVKLLRVLDEKRFMRVGGTETVQVDTRILAATNRDLDGLVGEGGFRSDLYYRLKVVTLTVPPLRERPEDVPLLVHHFLEQFKAENRRPNLTMGPEAVDLLVRARWTGNVRELRNLIESLVVLSTRDRIEPGDIPAPYRHAGGPPPPGPAGPKTMDEIERQAILRTLEETGGNRTRAAEILGIGLRTLQRKLKEYGETAAQEKGPSTPFWRDGDPAAPQGGGETR